MDGPLLIATASLAGVVILATVGIAALIVNQGRDMRREIAGLRAGQAEICERMARLEGLLEGLREAVSGRRAA